MKSKLKDILIILVVGITICILSIVGANAYLDSPHYQYQHHRTEATVSNLIYVEHDIATKLNAYLIMSEQESGVTDGIRITWDPVPGVETYYLFRHNYIYGCETLPQNFGSNWRAVTSSTSFVDLTVEPGKLYFYVLLGKGSDPTLVENWSDTISIYTSSILRTVPRVYHNYIMLQINNIVLETKEASINMDTSPMIKDDRTVLPIRAVVETIGGSISWEPMERKVSIISKGQTLEMWVDSQTYRVNGVEGLLDVAPFISDDRTYVPLRFVSENLQSSITWVNRTKEVLIQY